MGFDETLDLSIPMYNFLKKKRKERGNLIEFLPATELVRFTISSLSRLTGVGVISYSWAGFCGSSRRK
jgi:hypothetical protein